MKTIAIGYAYPTSPNAKTYGMYDTGCYTVSIDDENGCHTVSGHATFEQAAAAACRTGLEFHKYSMNKEEVTP